MINKVELGSVNSKNNPLTSVKSKDKTNFTGLGDFVLKGIQVCEQKPMINVAVLDGTTAIIPRTFFETFIGSKQKDENGEEKKRKLNLLGGFEALRRESSGLLINCIIPSFIVEGAAKILNRPIMGKFNKSNLTKSWANGDALKVIEKYYKNTTGSNTEEHIFNTLKTMFDDIEGIDGKEFKKFSEIFANEKEYNDAIKEMAKNIVSDKPKKNFAQDMYKYLVTKSGIAENIRFKGDKALFINNLEHVCESAADVLHGVVKEGIKDNTELLKYFTKAKHLVNAKSLAGLGIIIPLAISAQPINRWITHKLAGRKGAPIYNDDKERILSPEEKKKLTGMKFFAIPLMWAVAGLSMLMERPSLKMFQFKGIFPTMDQARIISAATFSSRLATAEDPNELCENTIRDIATFSSFYFLGDYAAKAIATLLEKSNKSGIKLINRIKDAPEGANIFQKFWTWAKHTKMKSTDELGAITDSVLRSKAKNLRAVCQLGNLLFSLISLGVFIPIYTRTQAKKKDKIDSMKFQYKPLTGQTTFTQNLIKDNSNTFKSFFN